MATYAAKVQQLNDAFRQSVVPKQGNFTAGMTAMGDPFCFQALEAVRVFNSFTSENDPYGEHDFGSLEIGEERVVWKIDYFDHSLSFGSENPSDSDQTTRVLTVMLAHEY